MTRLALLTGSIVVAFALAAETPMEYPGELELVGYNVGCFHPDETVQAMDAVKKRDAETVDKFIRMGWCSALRPGIYPYIAKNPKTYFIRYGAFRLYVPNQSVGAVKLTPQRGRLELSAKGDDIIGEIDLAGYHVACFTPDIMKGVILASTKNDGAHIQKEINAGACAALAPGVYAYMIKDELYVRLRHEGFRLWIASPDLTKVRLGDQSGRNEVSGK